MENRKKKQKKRYIITIIAGILFLAYGIWAMTRENDLVAVTAIGAAILLGISFVVYYKDDKKKEQERQAREEQVPVVTEELAEQVYRMKEKNQDIQAIKLVREQTGMSLYDAKNYVDGVSVKTQ